MAKVSFFIDGFNVYHSLVAKYPQYLWLDFFRLAQKFVRTGDTLADIFYFSAYTTWNKPEMSKQKKFIDVLTHRGVKVILGKFKEKDRFCHNCHTHYKSHEEKQTDVNISIYLFKEAIHNTYDTSIIMSNDTDLIPAIEAVKEVFPGKKVGVLFPIDRWATELFDACHFVRKVKKTHLMKSQFSDNVVLPSGIVLTRPKSWR